MMTGGVADTGSVAAVPTVDVSPQERTPREVGGIVAGVVFPAADPGLLLHLTPLPRRDPLSERVLETTGPGGKILLGSIMLTLKQCNQTFQLARMPSLSLSNKAWGM